MVVDSALFKKKDMYKYIKYTSIMQDYGRVVGRALVDNVVALKHGEKCLWDVRVSRGQEVVQYV